jgi:hypothetical protein
MFLPMIEGDGVFYLSGSEKAEPEIGNRKSETGNWKPEIGNRKLDIGNWNPGTGRRQCFSRKN